MNYSKIIRSTFAGKLRVEWADIKKAVSIEEPNIRNWMPVRHALQGLNNNGKLTRTLSLSKEEYVINGMETEDDR